MKDKWKFVDKFEISEYKCGLTVGQTVRLKSDLIVRDHEGNPTGDIHRAGEQWKVLKGSEQDPGIVFLLQPDGLNHTWDDDSSIFDSFEVVA